MGVLNFLKNLRLGLRLNLTIFLTLVVLLMSVIFVSRISLQNFTTQSGQQRVDQEVQIVKTQFDIAEHAQLDDINTVSNAPGLAEAIESRDTQQIRLILLSSAARLGVNELDVVDTTGERLLNLSGEFGASADYDQEDDLLALALIGSDVTGALFAEGDEGLELRLAATVPVRNAAGQIVGALLASKVVDDAFLGQLNFNRQNIQLILMGQGQILARTFAEQGHEGHDSLVGLTDVLLDPAVNEQALNGQVVIADNILTSDNGLPNTLAYMPLTVGGETQATIGVLAELSDLINFQRQLVTTTSLIFVVLALIALVVVAFFAARNISLPLNKLRATAQQMTGGDYTQRVEVTSADEIGQLGDTFNDMGGQIQRLIASLEDQVAARTARLEAVASLSEQLTPILDLEELLSQVVTQIQNRFGYYHTHIYLLDPSQETLALAAGSGQAGIEMRAKGHSIPLNAPTSLVARSARSGEIVTVDNVRETPDWLPNPLLPDTRSEMAIPVVLEGQVAGVLDVQQDKIGALDDGDANLLRTLANQVAVGIRNAQQFATVQKALAESQAIQAQYLEQTWDKSKLNRFATAQAEVRLTTMTAGQGETQELTSVLTTPIELRQKTIGRLDMEDTNPQRVWSQDELALVNAVVDQVAQAAENLRLFEETRERAGREATIREITDKLRAAPNIDSLLETAARELGARLGVKHTVLELGVEASALPDSNGKEGAVDH